MGDRHVVEEASEQTSRFYQAGTLKQKESSGDTVSPAFNVVEKPTEDADVEDEKSAAEGEESDHGKEKEVERSVGVEGFPALSSRDGETPPAADAEMKDDDGAKGAKAEDAAKGGGTTDGDVKCSPCESSHENWSEEWRQAMRKKYGTGPSRAEYDEHMRCHFPYRSWCKFCVEGRGRSDAHKKGAAREVDRQYPHLSIDYGYLRDQAHSGVSIQVEKMNGGVIIGGMESRAGLLIAMLIPEKGTQERWVARRIASWVDKLGCNTITIRGDTEGAMNSLIDDVRKARKEGTATIPEPPMKGDSQGNHYAEGAINIIKGAIRTLRAAAESRLGIKLTIQHPLTAFLVEWAATSRNFYQVGQDGRTAIERLKGHRVAKPSQEFAERVLFLPPAVKNKSDGRQNSDFRSKFLSGTTSDSQHSLGITSWATNRASQRAAPCDQCRNGSDGARSMPAALWELHGCRAPPQPATPW